MRRYLITGVAGTGKTALSKELAKRGVNAIDFPADLCYWRHKITKQIDEYHPEVSKGWMESHERICDIQKLKRLLDKQKEDVVITGVANGNMDEVVKLFDKIFLLQCSKETLLHRMKTRDNPSGFGKTAEEQEKTLIWQDEFDPRLLVLGATPINTEGDFEKIARGIISFLDSSSSVL